MSTYNLWLVNIANPTITKYCSTTVGNDIQEAINKTIIGCKIDTSDLLFWRWADGNPRFNEEEQELQRAFVSKQLG